MATCLPIRRQPFDVPQLHCPHPRVALLRMTGGDRRALPQMPHRRISHRRFKRGLAVLSRGAKDPSAAGHAGVDPYRAGPAGRWLIVMTRDRFVFLTHERVQPRSLMEVEGGRGYFESHDSAPYYSFRVVIGRSNGWA